MSSPKVLFMGTPDFAVAILDALVKDGVEIVGVVTAPDKPAGRGKKLRESDVKKYAVENSLNLIQPMNLKNSDFLSDLQDLNADLFVVVAFRMLPEVVWGMPPMGTINLHASLLPNYRGAAPIHRAILNGETKTGVSTFFIEKEIDTGEILEQEEVLIGSNETVGELYGRLMHLGASCTVSTVRKLQEGTLTGIPQNNYDQSDLKSAPKIFKEDGLLNFNLSAQEVHNHIRGLDPYPAAWCRMHNADRDQTKTYKLFGSEVTGQESKESTSLKAEADGILFPCSDFFVKVTSIQAEGKRRMNFKDFLAGNSIESLKIVE